MGLNHDLLSPAAWAVYSPPSNPFNKSLFDLLDPSWVAVRSLLAGRRSIHSWQRALGLSYHINCFPLRSLSSVVALLPTSWSWISTRDRCSDLMVQPISDLTRKNFYPSRGYSSKGSSIMWGTFFRSLAGDMIRPSWGCFMGHFLCHTAISRDSKKHLRPCFF